MSVIEYKNVSMSYGKNTVVNHFNLSVEKGEFITIIGSSGCGKTTILKMVNGLILPTSGDVLVQGENTKSVNLTELRRNIGYAIQGSVLFPHMTVADNIGYGLKLKKVPKAEIRKRVAEMLELVQLPGYEKRKPSELSGGQRQRVAIARSLVNNPKVLLLDEPLGALDLQLRRAMQLELKKLQKKLGITFVYITHDQEEAINMSDRIAVMNQGRFEQIGSPDEIYNHPKTSYVATFVGNANILKGTVEAMESDQVRVSLVGGTVLAAADGNVLQAGTPVTLAVRSENIVLDETCQKGLDAEVVEKSFAGGLLRVVLKLTDGTEVIASRYGIDASVQPGQKVTCFFEPENAVLVDLDTESGVES